ncbi:reelin domain-containing protein 1 [Monodelphis domestica]|uniref:reelin domain-containing protein 1 n=1 Tax=Monodelphis domestica TaxID=13616 RepID=UPI0024E20986|nr:reelin domain-containing protein 1 [Monodelphis domestica]
MKIQGIIIGWTYATFYLATYTDAFSHGASLVACVDMKPRHIRAQLQNPRNNYITIYTNASSYSPGDKIPVTVRSRRDFMGFLLQARRVSNDQIAGTFIFIPSGSKLMTCFEEANSVTHSDKSLKRNLSFVWKAPPQPIGDIKFFLSVVQSYFIYWERIESTIVSQQIQNRILSDGNVEPTTSLQKPNDPEVTTTGTANPLYVFIHCHPHLSSYFHLSYCHQYPTLAELKKFWLEPIWVANKYLAGTYVQFTILAMAASRSQSSFPQQTQKAEFAIVSPIGTSVTDSLDPVLGGPTTEVLGDEVHLLKPSPLHDTSAVAFSGDQRGQPDWDSGGTGSDQTLEPSLDVRGLERALTLGSLKFEDYASGRNTHNRTHVGSNSGTGEPCFLCDEDEQVRPEAYNLTLSRPPSSMGTPFTVHLSYPPAIMAARTKTVDDDGATNSRIGFKASAALRRLALRISVLPKSSASFLTQSENMNPREEGDGEESTGHPPLTHPEFEAAGPGRKEEGAPPRAGIVTTQLGILLCLSAALGMALAAGLRCLHAQYCRQRSEVSFGEREPHSDIIAVRDSGERMHFRKTRENSVLLVQAQYNWIAPNSGTKRTVV